MKMNNGVMETVLKRWFSRRWSMPSARSHDGMNLRWISTDALVRSNPITAPNQAKPSLNTISDGGGGVATRAPPLENVESIESELCKSVGRHRQKKAPFNRADWQRPQCDMAGADTFNLLWLLSLVLLLSLSFMEAE